MSYVLQLLYNDTDQMATTLANFHISDKDSGLANKLSESARFVFSRLVLCAGYDKKTNEWTARMDYNHLHRKTGISVRHIKRTVKLLEEHHLLVVERKEGDGGDEVNLYTLPSREMWRVGRINAAKEREIIAICKQVKKRQLAAMHKLAPELLDADGNVANPSPAASTADQAILDSISTGPFTVDTDDADDIAAINAKTDAACLAATGGDCLTIATPATPSPTANDAARLQELQGYVLGIYARLKCTDAPQDLTSSARAMGALLKKEGPEEASRVYEFVLDCKDSFWRDGLQTAKDGPVAYFARNFDAIRKQADEAASKKSKATPAPAPVKVWNQERWQRDYDRAQLAMQAACEKGNPNTYSHWDAIILKLDAERAAQAPAPAVEVEPGDNLSCDEMDYYIPDI